MNEYTIPIDTITGLGGTGAIVGLFLWYMTKRDVMMKEIVDDISGAMRNMGDKIDKLATAITKLDDRIHHVEKIQKQEYNRKRKQDQEE